MNDNENSSHSSRERNGYVVRPTEETPLVELVPGSFSHLVWGDKVMVSFLTMTAGSVFEIHKHPHEQIMIVTEGYCDEIVDGVKHRVEKGDVIVIPSNVMHGAVIGDVDCKVIDIFSPVRDDYKEILHKQSSGQGKEER